MASVLSAPLLESFLVVPRKPMQILTIFARWDGSTTERGAFLPCTASKTVCKHYQQSDSDRVRWVGGGASATDRTLVDDFTAGLTI
jgi:hypothetical protein